MVSFCQPRDEPNHRDAGAAGRRAAGTFIGPRSGLGMRAAWVTSSGTLTVIIQLQPTPVSDKCKPFPGTSLRGNPSLPLRLPKISSDVQPAAVQTQRTPKSRRGTQKNQGWFCVAIRWGASAERLADARSPHDVRDRLRTSAPTNHRLPPVCRSRREEADFPFRDLRSALRRWAKPRHLGAYRGAGRFRGASQKVTL